MLIQFEFENYRSFRNKTTLDFTATKMQELSEHITTIGKERILPAAIIYGANASGKSNVLSAFNFMRKFVLASAVFGEVAPDGKDIEMPEVNTYLFDDVVREGPQSFEVYFTSKETDTLFEVDTAMDAELQKEYIYNYGFVLDKSGIKEEWLNKQLLGKRATKVKTILYRDENGIIEYSGISAKTKSILEYLLSNQKLCVSLVPRIRVSTSKKSKEKVLNAVDFYTVYNWFYDAEIVNFGNLMSTYELEHSMPENFSEQAEVRSSLAKYIHAFDSSIEGLEVETNDKPSIEDATEREEENSYVVYSLHKMNDTDRTERLSFAEESSGTQKMVALYSPLQDVLKNGSILFVDELNARLHPLLLRSILQLFLDPEKNKNHAQIVMTSHEPWLLSSGLFRRDEIWFVQKNVNGISELYSLPEFKGEDGKIVRAGESLEKNYLFGKYGAIPHMKNFGLVEENN